MGETKTPIVWDGPPCVKCGKPMPRPEQIGRWLLVLTTNSQKHALTNVRDFPRQADQVGFLTDALAFTDASLQSFGHQLAHGLCGDCSYAEHSNGDDEFHMKVRAALRDAFPAEVTHGN